MRSFRTRLSEGLEKSPIRRIVHPSRIGVMYEQVVLDRFLSDFNIDVIFDVGANTGQYARMIRDRTSFRGPIISIEPIPELAAGLRRRAVHDAAGWFIEECALSDEPGDARFSIMNGDQFSSLHQPKRAQIADIDALNQVRSAITVRLETLDSVFIKYQNLLGFKRPFLKMDTQGHDMAVVRGAGKRLGEFAGLQSELSVRPLYENSLRFDEALAQYEALGFTLSAIFPNNGGHFPDLIEFDCVLYNPAFRA